MKKILAIELVPQTAWFSNVRSMVSKKDWDILRKDTYKRAGYKCEICGEMGVRYPVECHEIWKYDDVSHIQKLIGMIALCPSCHEVKHIGLASKRGRGEVAIKHLAKINKWTRNKTNAYVNKQIQKWKRRSNFNWEVDLTWLDKKGIKYETYRKS